MTVIELFNGAIILLNDSIYLFNDLQKPPNLFVSQQNEISLPLYL